MGTSTKNKLGKCQISPGKIEHMERNCLFSKLKIQQEKVEKFQSHLQSIYQLLKFSCETKLIFENKKRYILNKVLTLEISRDANRDRN